MLMLSANTFAITGKQEFLMKYSDEELRFINDINVMYVLQIAKNDKDSLQREGSVKCSMTPLVNNVAKIGNNTIIFYEDFALVNNKKRRFYIENKTDLLFYRDICPKKKK